MKRTILLAVSIWIAVCLSSCSKVQPEEKAAIVKEADYTMCGGCGGWIVQVDSTWYRADVVAPYNQENTPVWIRFRKDESGGNKVAGRWINISSIRHRK